MKRSIKFITTIKWRGQNLLISGMKRWYCYGWIRGCYVQLAKSVQGLMWETTKLWWNKSNKIQINGDMPCSWIGTLPIVKTSVLPKLIYRFKTVKSTVIKKNTNEKCSQTLTLPVLSIMLYFKDHFSFFFLNSASWLLNDLLQQWLTCYFSNTIFSFLRISF